MRYYRATGMQVRIEEYRTGEHIGEVGELVEVLDGLDFYKPGIRVNGEILLGWVRITHLTPRPGPPKVRWEEVK